MGLNALNDTYKVVKQVILVVAQHCYIWYYEWSKEIPTYSAQYTLYTVSRLSWHVLERAVTIMFLCLFGGK